MYDYQKIDILMPQRNAIQRNKTAMIIAIISKKKVYSRINQPTHHTVYILTTNIQHRNKIFFKDACVFAKIHKIIICKWLPTN